MAAIFPPPLCRRAVGFPPLLCAAGVPRRRRRARRHRRRAALFGEPPRAHQAAGAPQQQSSAPHSPLPPSPLPASPLPLSPPPRSPLRRLDFTCSAPGASAAPSTTSPRSAKSPRSAVPSGVSHLPDQSPQQASPFPSAAGAAADSSGTLLTYARVKVAPYSDGGAAGAGWRPRGQELEQCCLEIRIARRSGRFGSAVIVPLSLLTALGGVAAWAGAASPCSVTHRLQVPSKCPPRAH